MSERNNVGPGHNGDPGDQAYDPSVLAPEVVTLVGEDTVRYMDRAAEALDELDKMAVVEDPFVHDDRGHQVDLGFLNDEQVQLVSSYRAVDRPFKGIPTRTVAKFGRKMLYKLPPIHRKVRQDVDDAELHVDKAGEAIGKAAEESRERDDQSMLSSLQQCMTDIVAARNMLPSKFTMLIVDNMYGAGINARNAVQSLAGQQKVRMGTPKAVVQASEDLRQGRETFKGVTRIADSIRRLGTANFKLLQELVEAERIKEALGVLTVADTARERLPETEGLEEHGAETIAAAERYISEHVLRAEAVLQDTDPELLKDDRVRAIVARKRPGSHEQVPAEQAERQLSVDNDTLGKLTEAKNILRGGRRLKPESNGQTEDEIKRIADELHALKDGRENPLLDPEESGVIVAMATGKFEGFAGVLEAVKQQAANGGLNAFPAERSGVVRELDRLDLGLVLAKIESLLDDPDSRLHLEKILGMEMTRDVRTILAETLESAGVNEEEVAPS